MSSSHAFKHFCRKKFFYRLFWRSSPKAGAIWSLSWLALIFTIVPAAFFGIFFRAADLNRWAVPALIVLALFGVAAWGYGVAVLSASCCALVKRKESRMTGGVLKVLAIACSFFFAFAGLVCAVIYLRAKRTTLGILAVFGAVLWLLGAFYMAIPPMTGWLLTLAGLLLTLLSFLGLPGRAKLRWTAWIPLVILCLYCFGVRIYAAQLQKRVQLKQAELSGRLHASVNSAPQWAGLREPKAAWSEEPFAAYLQLSHHAPLDERIADPAYLAGVESFLQQPLQKLRLDGDYLATLPLPQIAALRGSAEAVAELWRRSSADRDQWLRRNAQMQQLRDWALQDDFAISWLSAVVIESTRLQLIGESLQSEGLSNEQFEQLLGPAVPWQERMLRGFAMELAATEEVGASLQHGNKLPKTEEYEFFARRSPTEFGLFIQVDLLASLAFYENYFREIQTESAPATQVARNMNRWVEQRITPYPYLLSGIFLPAIHRMAAIDAVTIDRRNWMRIAFAVKRFEQNEGRLPESLQELIPAYLPAIPATLYDGMPPKYTHGELKDAYNKPHTGFRIQYASIPASQTRPAQDTLDIYEK